MSADIIIACPLLKKNVLANKFIISPIFLTVRTLYAQFAHVHYLFHKVAILTRAVV